VRVASSKSTTESERMQRECDEGGLKMGPNARRASPKGLEDVLGVDGFARVIDYDDVSASLLATPTTLSKPIYARAHVPAELGQARAHLKLK